MILLRTNNILLLRVYNLQSSLIFLFASVKSTGFTLFLFVGTFSGELFETGYPQSAFTCSKLTIETLEQGVKYVQS